MSNTLEKSLFLKTAEDKSTENWENEVSPTEEAWKGKDEHYTAPTNDATPADMRRRKVLDTTRWFCISRPQLKETCGISSLTSCWNFLYSTLGNGRLKPITQEEALLVLGFKPPFSQIRFGPFTGNRTVMRWFNTLNQHYNVKGRSYILYKPRGNYKTDVQSCDALHMLKEGLIGNEAAYIYHCDCHYFCPIGYEDIPKNPDHAYRCDLASNEVDTSILIADPNTCHPTFHCKRWDDIEADLNCEFPNYMDIRRLWLGVQKYETERDDVNNHCVIAFTRE